MTIGDRNLLQEARINIEDILAKEMNPLLNKDLQKLSEGINKILEWDMRGFYRRAELE